ncbi:MAG: hypothetical protein ABFS45_18200 [Pseudomonadota bacterium]
MNDEIEASPEIRFLKQHIQHASMQLEQQNTQQSEGMGSLIYLGNHQDAIPRNLILDPHLESGEIHTWTLLKIHLANPAMPSSIPSQNDLMETLKCSRPILSRHLAVLRALRWITLCAEVRGKDGQFRGNVYAQHDTPLSLQDTLYLDQGYIQFMEQPSSGPSLKRLRQIKEAVLKHMDYQVIRGVQLDRSPTQLERVSALMKGLSSSDPLDTPLACPEGATQPNQLANLYGNSDQSEQKPDFYLGNIKESDHVNNIDTVDRVNIYMDKGSSSSSYIKTTTTTHQHLNFPKTLDTERLRLYAAKTLSDLEESQQQFALDYLADRIQAGEKGTEKSIVNPIGFLGWIVRHINDGTLPVSTYGMREEPKRTTQMSDVDDKAKRQKEHEAWIQSMHDRGYEIDPESSMPVKRQDVARG